MPVAVAVAVAVAVLQLVAIGLLANVSVPSTFPLLPCAVRGVCQQIGCVRCTASVFNIEQHSLIVPTPLLPIAAHSGHRSQVRFQGLGDEMYIASLTAIQWNNI